MIRVLGVADPAVLTYADEEKKIISRWSEKSGVDVEFSILPWVEYFAALMATLESEDGGSTSAYDIVMVAGHLWLQDFINRGFLQPLTGIREAVDKYAPYSGILGKVREEIEVNGTPWLIPSFTDGHILFYKKDIITEVTGAELPQTLSPTAYLDLLKKIGASKAGTGRKFAAVKADPSEIFLDWLPFYYETSGALFDGDLKPLFNTKEGTAALSRYLELKNFALPGAETAGNEAVCEALQSDDCFIGVSWGGQASFIVNDEVFAKGNMGFATYSTPWNVSWSFGAPAGAELNDEIRDFLAYIVSPEVDTLIGAGAGSPVRQSSYENAGPRQPWYPVQQKMVSLARPLPGFTGSGEIFGLFYKWIAKAWAGEAAPETALAELEKAVVKELKKR